MLVNPTSDDMTVTLNPPIPSREQLFPEEQQEQDPSGEQFASVSSLIRGVTDARDPDGILPRVFQGNTSVCTQYVSYLSLSDLY